jgi:hypothetical protein
MIPSRFILCFLRPTRRQKPIYRYLGLATMSSLSREIDSLRQAIASAEETADDDQILGSLDKQFTSWDDLVAPDSGDAARTRLETEIEKCHKVQGESEVEVSGFCSSVDQPLKSPHSLK